MMIRRILFLLVLLAWPHPAAIAGVTITNRPGSWSDVVRHRDGFAHVWLADRTVIAEVDGRERWRATLPRTGLYLRAATCDARGDILAALQGADDQLLLVYEGAVFPGGVTVGQNVVVVACQSGQFIAYVQRALNFASRLVLDGGRIVEDVRFPIALTTQGFRDMRPDGTAILGDSDFLRPLHGYKVTQPNEREGVIAGQWAHRDAIGLVWADGSRAFTVIDWLGFEPHLAVRGTTIAVASRTVRGATLAIVTPPYPRTETPAETGVGAPAPPPIEPPPPSPPDVGPDKAKARQIVGDERAKFGPMDRAQLAQLLRAIARALNAAGLDGGPFGVLIKTGGNNCDGISCDVICAGNGPTQRQWDVIGSSDPGEAQSPMWREVPREQVRVRECVVPDGPVELPLPPPDCRACEAEREDLRETAGRFWQELGETRGQVTQLQIQRDEIAAERDALRRQLDAILAQPDPTCRVTGPGWVRNLFGIRCEVVR